MKDKYLLIYVCEEDLGKVNGLKGYENRQKLGCFFFIVIRVAGLLSNVILRLPPPIPNITHL